MQNNKANKTQTLKQYYIMQAKEKGISQKHIIQLKKARETCAIPYLTNALLHKVDIAQYLNYTDADKIKMLLYADIMGIIIPKYIKSNNTKLHDYIAIKEKHLGIDLL